jgi:hypothetical protein
MKDLEREKKLERLIYEKTEKCEKRKWLRVKRTFFVLSGSIYLIALYRGLKDNSIDIRYCISWLVASPVLAGFIMFGAILVLLYILTGSLKEEKEIAELKGKYIERKCFINSEDE